MRKTSSSQDGGSGGILVFALHLPLFLSLVAVPGALWVQIPRVSPPLSSQHSILWSLRPSPRSFRFCCSNIYLVLEVFQIFTLNYPYQCVSGWMLALLNTCSSRICQYGLCTFKRMRSSWLKVGTKSSDQCPYDTDRHRKFRKQIQRHREEYHVKIEAEIGAM